MIRLELYDWQDPETLRDFEVVDIRCAEPGEIVASLECMDTGRSVFGSVNPAIIVRRIEEES